MAECVMKDMLKKRGLEREFYIDSSATSDEERGNPIYPAAARKLKEMGVEIVDHFARQLTREDYCEYDYFVGMEERNVRAMKRILGGDSDNKVMRLLDHSEDPRDIADPWWTGNFDVTYKDICEGCESLLGFIASKTDK